MSTGCLPTLVVLETLKADLSSCVKLSKVAQTLFTKLRLNKTNWNFLLATDFKERNSERSTCYVVPHELRLICLLIGLLNVELNIREYLSLYILSD